MHQVVFGPKKLRALIDGDLINMASKRLQTFRRRGIKCIRCGIEGKYFYKERHRVDIGYHFNLYAINDKNEEILMTKDHIIPKSKGGKDRLDNFQTMCSICNEDKADKQ